MHLKNVRLYPEKGPKVDRYPFNLPIFHQTHRIDFTATVTFFVGENGAGKSTLLKALAKKCRIHVWQNAEGTRFNNNPYEDRLGEFIDVRWADGPVPGAYFDAEIYRDFAAFVDEWAAADPGQLAYYGGKSLMAQSHGQSLMSYFRSRYRIRGLYFLDEPETALSPKSQIELLKVLNTMSGSGKVQFIIATHSPILMACPDAAIYSFDTIPVTRVDYEDTSHYKVYRDFMADRNVYI